MGYVRKLLVSRFEVKNKTYRCMTPGIINKVDIPTYSSGYMHYRCKIPGKTIVLMYQNKAAVETAVVFGDYGLQRKIQARPVAAGESNERI